MPSLSPLLPLSPRLMLMLGTATMATVTVAMDGAATTGLMATMATTERDLQMLSQSLLLLLSPRLMLMPGTATTATAATDGVATTGLTTMATMERGPQMLSQSLRLPRLRMGWLLQALLLWLLWKEVRRC